VITHRVVLVRHGTPEVEEGVPAAEWPLSACARNAAISLAQSFRGCTFDRIASSPEPKATGTAEVIASQLGLAVEIDQGFSEHSRRSVGFLTQDELGSAVARLFDNPDSLVFGEETANQAYARFCAALERQSARSAHDTLIVTHGTIMSIYVSRVLNIDPLPFWRSLKMPMAVILDDGKMRLVEPTVS
jgi:2,3-bisphosphoglycerate-dependent phosphoglycerate mutase